MLLFSEDMLILQIQILSFTLTVLFILQSNVTVSHLERISSRNHPRRDSRMAEWQRQHRKHSTEEKSAEAVQGMFSVIIVCSWFRIPVVHFNFDQFWSLLNLFAGISVHLFRHGGVVQAVPRALGQQIVQRQRDACVIKVNSLCWSQRGFSFC